MSAEYSIPLTRKVNPRPFPFRQTAFVSTYRADECQPISFVANTYLNAGEGIPFHLLHTRTYRDTDTLLAAIGDTTEPVLMLAADWDAQLEIGSDGYRQLYDAGLRLDMKPPTIFPTRNARHKPFCFRLLNADGQLIAEMRSVRNYFRDLPSQWTDHDNPAAAADDIQLIAGHWLSLATLTLAITGSMPSVTASATSMDVLKRYPGCLPSKPAAAPWGNLHRDGSPDPRGNPTLNVHQAEIDAYSGGRIDTFYQSDTWLPMPVYNADINSMYPYILTQPLPIRYESKVSRQSAVRALDGHPARHSAYLFAGCRLDIPETDAMAFYGLASIPLPSPDRWQKVNCYPVGRFTASLWQPEAEIAYRNGWLRDWDACYRYRTRSIAKPLITDLYRRRQDYRKTDNEPMANAAKLLMNGIYGKFGMREFPQWEKVDPDSDEYRKLAYHDGRFGLYDTPTEWPFGSEQENEYLQIGWDLWRQPILAVADRPVARQSVLSIAGYVTSRGRAMMHDAIAAVVNAGGNVFAVNTDAIWTDIMPPAEMLHPTRLGKFKVKESAAGKARFLGINNYWFDGKQTLAGDPRLKTVRAKTAVHYPATARQALAGKPEGSQLELMPREFNPNDGKRLPSEGWRQPIKVDGW